MFAEIKSPTNIVIQHVSGPKYHLNIVLAPADAGTVVSWSQEFENSDFASRMPHILRPSNEQNLDRLSAEVFRKPGG